MITESQIRLDRGPDVLSAATITLPSKGAFSDLTLGNQVSAVNAVRKGFKYDLNIILETEFVHHPTNLIVPGDANYTFKPGDTITLFEYANGLYEIINVQSRDGLSMRSKIIDIDIVTKTDTQTITDDLLNEDWEDVAGLFIDVQPVDTTDIVIVECSVNGGVSVLEAMFVRCVRIVDPLGSPVETAVGVGDAASNRIRAGADIYPDASAEQDNASWSFKDTPSTISLVRYQVQAAMANFTTEVGYINRSVTDNDNEGYSRTISSIKITHKRAL